MQKNVHSKKYNEAFGIFFPLDRYSCCKQTCSHICFYYFRLQISAIVKWPHWRFGIGLVTCTCGSSQSKGINGLISSSSWHLWSALRASKIFKTLHNYWLGMSTVKGSHTLPDPEGSHRSPEPRTMQIFGNMPNKQKEFTSYFENSENIFAFVLKNFVGPRSTLWSHWLPLFWPGWFSCLHYHYYSYFTATFLLYFRRSTVKFTRLYVNYERDLLNYKSV